MNKIKKYIKEILSFALILFVSANLLSYYKSLDLNKEKFSIKNIQLIDGFNYSYPKNEVLMVHFWATWCPVCKVEAPNIEILSKQYNVLTISSDSGDDINVLNFIKKNNLKFDVLNDKHGNLAKKFNIQAYPTTLIYDKNRNLIFSEVGYTSTLGLKFRMWWASL